MSGGQPSILGAAFQRPLLRRALLVAVVVVHVGFVIAPLDVLFPVVAHERGQLLLHGKLPYRDFPFEYPPVAAVLFLLPGLAPAGIAKAVLALQALALELFLVQRIIRPRGPEALWRWALASLVVFPFISGGFDAAPMVALAVATALLAEGRAVGWWVAALGAAVKLTPGVVWSWARTSIVTGIVAAAVAGVVLLAPTLLAKDSDDAWLGFSAHRGVQVESTAGVTSWLLDTVQGEEPTFVYNEFKSWQVEGAEGAARVWTVVAVIGGVVLLVRCGRHGPTDPWLASLAASCLLLVGFKVFSPQFIVWATPLAVVLGGRWWKLWLAVLATTLAAYAIGGNDAPFFLTIGIRNALVVATAVLALRELRPSPAGVGPGDPFREPVLQE